MKTIICEKNEAVEKTAELVAEALREKPDAVLALSCGETMVPLWARLAALCSEGSLSLRDARIFCVTEFCDVPEEKSCRFALTRGLIETTDAQIETASSPIPRRRKKRMHGSRRSAASTLRSSVSGRPATSATTSRDPSLIP